MTSNLKIALTGNTGVGKDTFVQILRKDKRFSALKEIKLADPLYEVQNFIYNICQETKNYFVQDGELLNFLGKHMRKINPNVLENYFLQELNKIKESYPIILCSDARPQDLNFIRQQNFLVIKITTDKKLSIKRRMLRGDISLANANHQTEIITDDISFDYCIENNKTLHNYQETVLKLIEGLYDSHRR